MAGTQAPAPVESRAAGLSGPSLPSSGIPFVPNGPSYVPRTTPSPARESGESDGVVHPVETISMHTLHSMLARMLERTEALSEAQASTNQILDELRRQSRPTSQEIDECLHRVEALSESLRADCTRQHEELINAVRATANEQVPYNIQGYLDEFSTAIGTEVRTLLSEVGDLREERQRIKHEIGYLMTLQSTLDRGGELGSDWPPGSSSCARPSRPGVPLWRNAQPRYAAPSQGNLHSASSNPSSPTTANGHVHTWVTWEPNPALAPTPPPVYPALLVPDRGSPGLFGPRSPRDSASDLPRESEISDPPNPNAHSRGIFDNMR